MPHPALSSGAVALITGAASGIGLATARALHERGVTVVMVDLPGARLDDAARAVGERAVARGADVSDESAIAALAEEVHDRFGPLDLLMSNAAARVSGGAREDLDEWRRTMDVNFWAAVHLERAFLPRMIEAARPALIVTTGSKQGITNPPGNVIYNVTKAALKTYTEQLQHQLRNREGCQVSAHLLVPGWTATGEEPTQAPGAWKPEQVAERLIARLEAGDFYIVCPDNEVTEEIDARRIRWAAGDIAENRPPLSRWHPDWTERFAREG